MGSVLAFDAAQMSFRDYLRAFFTARKQTSGLLYCWFAGRHALFPALLAKWWRKPFVIVAGGWDVANVPEIHYGLMRPGWKKQAARWILRAAHRLLAVSDSNYREILDNTGIPAEKISVIPHGFEIPSQKISLDEKDGSILSVGEVTQSNLKRKGIEVFVRSARFIPERTFYLAGRVTQEAREFLKREAPSNLIICDYVGQEELNRLFRKASVYVQVSYHEAFGCAVAEAMSYGCVPVVTNQYALPEVVGTACGVYVPYGDARKTAEGIRQALQVLPTLSECAQERVTRLFPLEARRQALIKLLQEIVDEY